MSLDVYLRTLGQSRQRVGNGIFVREGGHTREISLDEWNRKHPGSEPVRAVSSEPAETDIVYSGNITHNLGKMADAAGIYELLWTPEGIGMHTAGQAVPFLLLGLKRLREYHALYRVLNPANGWGTYELLVEFVMGYLEACEQYPDAVIEVSR